MRTFRRSRSRAPATNRHRAGYGRRARQRAGPGGSGRSAPVQRASRASSGGARPRERHAAAAWLASSLACRRRPSVTSSVKPAPKWSYSDDPSASQRCGARQPGWPRARTHGVLAGGGRAVRHDDRRVARSARPSTRPSVLNSRILLAWMMSPTSRRSRRPSARRAPARPDELVADVA